MNNSKIENIMSEIAGYKQLLSMSDYKAIKHSEGLISEYDYEATKVEREKFRTKINELEAQLEVLMATEE